MIFERVNVLNQCGASRRCLLNTTKLLDLLVTNLRYKKAAFYVVDQDKKYLGTITENTLADIPADMLSSNPAVGELLLSSPLLSSPLLILSMNAKRLPIWTFMCSPF